MPLDVLRELFHRRVTSLRLLAQGHKHNVVQVADEPFAKFLERALSCHSMFRRSNSWRSVCFGFRSADCGTELLGLIFAGRARKSVRRAARNSIRAASGQQFVKDRSQRVHIAGGGDRLTPDLLGTGISRCQDWEESQRGFIRLRTSTLSQYFGDAEVQKLRNALRGHQDVAGLDVAMDD